MEEGKKEGQTEEKRQSRKTENKLQVVGRKMRRND